MTYSSTAAASYHHFHQPHSHAHLFDHYSHPSQQHRNDPNDHFTKLASYPTNHHHHSLEYIKPPKTTPSSTLSTMPAYQNHHRPPPPPSAQPIHHTRHLDPTLYQQTQPQSQTQIHDDQHQHHQASSNDVLAILSRIDRPFGQISNDIAQLEHAVRQSGLVVGSTFFLALHEIYPVLVSELSLAVRLAAGFVLYDVYRAYDFQLNPFGSEMNEKPMKALVQQAQRDYAQLAAMSPAQFAQMWSSLAGDDSSIKPTLGNAISLSSGQNGPVTSRSNNINGNGLNNGLHRPPSSPQQGFSRKIERPKGSPVIQRPIPSPPQHPGGVAAPAQQLFKTASERVLNLRERRALLSQLSDLPTNLLQHTSLSSLSSHNAEIAYHVILLLLHSLSPTSSPTPTPTPTLSALTTLNSLSTLPPTPGSCDVLGRLINGPDGPIKEAIRERVLPEFLERAYQTCEDQMEFSAAVSGMSSGRYDTDVSESLAAEDNYLKTVQTVCQFAKTMMTSGILSPWDLDSEPIIVGMRHFALTHSRVAEAAVFYRVVQAFENP